eukprot:GILI01005394.1.p1 GENE.GILI01005394.1~~GILI01005394.1.p1  ORF type:complete len:470 (-),score=150.39 GILI01005394.1:235-1572(-)
MDSASIQDKAIELARLAVEADNAGRLEDALGLYKSSLQYFVHVIKYQPNEQLKKALTEKSKEYMARAEAIRQFLNDSNKEPVVVGGDSAPKKKTTKKGGGGGDDKHDKEEDDDPEKAKLRAALQNAVVTEKPNVKWSDVAGLDAAKMALQEAVILPTRFPQLFTGKRRPWKGILLYGPPGTGKSYLAKACATEASATFFSVSSSDLVSKWQGESERLVRNLFEMARASKPTIIFVDEIDSLCGARTDGENDSARRIKTEFLVQMDGVGKDDQGVLVLGATNVPWGLDSAIRRRFERRIYIPLPEEGARASMFKLHLGDTPNCLSMEDFALLGARTEGYSGSDISVVVKNALMEPIRKCQTAVAFKKVPNPKNPGAFPQDFCYEPCSPGDPQGEAFRLMDVPPEKVKPPDVVMDDFLAVLETTRPSVSPADLVQQEEFTSQFGQEG